MIPNSQSEVRSAGALGPIPESARLDTTILRAFAALIIVNSHLEPFYPRPWLAADGLLGNSLFFLLAGYGLVRSAQKGLLPFPRWFWRRLLRIYPALLLVGVTFALIIEGGWRTWAPIDYLTKLVWPTPFAFVELIFPFYAILYPLLRVGRRWVYPASILAAAVIYAIAYAHDISLLPSDVHIHLGERTKWVHDPAYFTVFALGGWLGWSDSPFARRLKLRWICLVSTAILYFGIKLAMVTGHGGRAYAALHVLVFVFCFCLFVTLADHRVVTFVRRQPQLWWFLSLVGALTLELYLVHEYLLDFKFWLAMPFPLNHLVFWPSAIILAVIAGRIATWLRVLIERPRDPRPAAGTAA